MLGLIWAPDICTVYYIYTSEHMYIYVHIHTDVEYNVLEYVYILRMQTRCHAFMDWHFSYATIFYDVLCARVCM